MTQIINELKALEAQPLLPQLRPNQGFHNTSKFRVSALLASFLIILFSLQNLSLNRDNEEAILWQEIKSSKILFGSDENGPKFLSRAIALDNKVMVEYILMHGGNYVDDNQRIDAKPLHVASVEGLFPTAKYLLQSGDKVDTITKYNWTPLHWACYNGHVQIVELLLEYGGHQLFGEWLQERIFAIVRCGYETDGAC
ncbi:ankyrin [Rhizoclosmatium globosum]|uniref:Ankyrin n=1 Tax=Rhizoclosmatium globosum TaxID=329046 RepID=A0A1Y2CH56_9FUNG|nr:ankyrin [Rhizoclosmatium globosum]|eukprot:ORY46378.1 ankyrin [Rhizoclosmatium globosum]